MVLAHGYIINQFIVIILESRACMEAGATISEACIF